MSKELPLNKIRIDGDTQPRVKLDNATVAEYAEQMRSGVEFPDAVVYHDGTDYWLAQGFHRYFASKEAENLTINCEVRKGTVKEARIHAAGSNASHGLKRSNEDKRKAVAMMLAEAADWSDRKIAEHCSVGDHLVADVRSLQLRENAVEEPEETVGRDGKKRKRKRKPNTAKNKPPVEPEESEEPEQAPEEQDDEPEADEPAEVTETPRASSRKAHIAKGVQALGQLVRALDSLKVLEPHRNDLNKIETRLKGIK